MKPEFASQLPPQELDRRAAEQRQRIHESVSELKVTLRENIRERLDGRRFAREHLWQLAAGASAFALLIGYGITGMFTRH